MISFSGKVAIVTGAGSPTGIGFAAARGFAEGGATTICIDTKGAEEAAAMLSAAGAAAIGVTMDVRDVAAWTGLVADAAKRFGRVDILVNNAGIAVAGDTAADVSEEVWDRIMDINAKGVWLGMRAVLPGMLLQGSGKNCNIVSTAAHIGLRAAAAYCASKGAVLFLCSDGSSFMAGADISVDGGMVAL